MVTDEQLVKKVLNGEKRYFQDIVVRYQAKVRSVAKKVTHHDLDAEDVAQEVFIQVYRSLSSFQFNSSFSTWIYRITMNKALDWKRKHKKVEEETNIDDHSRFLELKQSLPEEVVLQQMNQQLMKEVIRNLPTKYQDVVKMYYFEEMSHQEIADNLEIARKTVESRLYRARFMLKEIVQKEGIR